MSAIICFDIRNYSTHTTHHSSTNNSVLFKVIKDTFECLENAIKYSRTEFGFIKQIFVNHTGDGFVVIFSGKHNALLSLIVASLLAIDADKLIKEYTNNINDDVYLRHISPLEYGIGIHRGEVDRFRYKYIYHKDKSLSPSPEMFGFLGHVINLSARIQESTKEHTFKIICTEEIYKDAISIIKDEYKETIEKYFTKLGKHKLRGMRRTKNIFGFKIDFAKKLKKYMLTSSDNKEL